MSDTLPATPAERLAAIVTWLASCIAEQGNLKRLPNPLIMAIWKRVREISARFLAVAATPPPAIKTPDRSGVPTNIRPSDDAGTVILGRAARPGSAPPAAIRAWWTDTEQRKIRRCARRLTRH